MRIRLPVIIVMLATLARVAMAGDPAAPDDGEWLVTPHGPAHVRNLSPIQSLRLSVVPELPSLLAPGHFEVFADVTWTNQWARQPQYDLDMDRVWIDLDGRLALNERLEVGLALRFGWRGDAVLAGLIDFWHGTVGLVENRDLQPPGQFIAKRNGVDLLDPATSHGWGMGDLTVRARTPIWFDMAGTTGASATLMIKLPVGEAADGYGTGGFDVGFTINGMFTYDRFTGTGAIGYVRHATVTVFGFPAREHQFVAWLAVELRVGPLVAIHLQLNLQTSVVTDTTVMEDPNMQFNAGFSFRLGGGLRLVISFLENTFGAENAIDMGWHAAFAWRY